MGLFITILLTFVLCTGCSNSVKIKNEEELLEDLLTNSIFYMSEDGEVSELSIIKRLTDQDDKTDTVYVSIEIEHEVYLEIRAYIMYYTCYNEGWLLEGIEEYNGNEIEWKNVFKNPPQIMTDEELSDIFIEHVTTNYPECNFTDYQVNISSRNASYDNISEDVNVWVNASNNIVSMNVNYSGYFYVDFNNEWQVGSIYVLDGNYEVLNSDITEEIARTYIETNDRGSESDYYDITLYDHKLELNKNKDTYIFNAKVTKTDPKMEVDRTIKVIFSFGLYSGWEFSDVKISGNDIIRDLGPESSGLRPVYDPTEFYR